MPEVGRHPRAAGSPVAQQRQTKLLVHIPANFELPFGAGADRCGGHLNHVHPNN